jgi:acetylornithine deacetylase/succinyl-diaminopimelate desuccinylase family protein
MPLIPDVVETLQQLIRIPSVNPMGRDVTGAPYLEGALTDYLQQFFQRVGVPFSRQSVAPGRDNIMARLDAPAGADQRPIVVFEAHQDTVPVDGMTIAPWEPRIDQGRVFGRGACDVKGGMACMLVAFARLAAQRSAEMPTLVLACSVNEENGFDGAQRLADSWLRGDSPVLPRAPDQVVVAEPTSLRLVVSHKGLVRWRCHATGRAAHSSCPENGENAIYHMAHAVLELQRYAAALQQRAGDPRLGPPTLSVGTIHGGLCVNAVPDLCTIEIDRRLTPDETPAAARQEVLAWLAQRTASSACLRHDPPFLASPGLSDRGSATAVPQLQKILHRQNLVTELVGVPYGTNAPFYAATGAPTVVFGPGSIDQAHTADEWIAIDQLHTAVEVYTAVGRGESIADQNEN